jgi:hypothetical protein
MFELLPKFRSTDQGLDMRDVVEKKSVKAKEFMDDLADDTFKYRNLALFSPGSRMGLREIEFFSFPSAIKKDLKKAAQTIRGDIEFCNFRIL